MILTENHNVWPSHRIRQLFHRLFERHKLKLFTILFILIILHCSTLADNVGKPPPPKEKCIWQLHVKQENEYQTVFFVVDYLYAF